MKSAKLGIFSAMLASVCCVGPVLLIVLGLGSLGFGALIGRYHWWFIGGAIVLLAVAWWSYLREAARCKTDACEMARSAATRTALVIASLVVAVFAGLNVLTYASQQHTTPTTRHTTHTALTAVTIPVEGMTCFTCTFAVESSLNKLPGVAHAKANVKTQTAQVSYDPTQVSLDDLVAAIHTTGYTTRRPIP